MSENLEEKFIEERLKHEKSERDLFEQLQKLIAENKELKEMMFVAESALMKQNKAYRKCLAEILEQVQDAINEKCNIPCEECTGRVLCDNYFIVNKIKELNNV